MKKVSGLNGYAMLSAVAFPLFAVAEMTNTCYLVKPADYAVIDWLDEANYDATQGGKPSDGGLIDIRVPDGAKILLDDGSIDQIKDFFVIYPGKNGEFVLSNTVAKTLNVAFFDLGKSTGDPDRSALVVKRGVGLLTLTSNKRRVTNYDHPTPAGNRLLDYGVSWTIEDGRVDFPGHSPDLSAAIGNRMMLGDVMLTTDRATMGLGRLGDQVSVASLGGTGTITSMGDADADAEIVAVMNSGTFGGRLMGRMSIRADAADIMLTNVTSTGYYNTSSD